VSAVEAPRPWINYAACAWAVVFGAPHVWWALGVPAGFPGGQASYDFFMSSTWRVVFDLVVVLLCGASIFIALVLARPGGPAAVRSMARIAAWIACAMLTLRGLAGLVVDGFSDPVWWPTFLAGGLLFAGVAWRAAGLIRPAG